MPEHFKKYVNRKINPSYCTDYDKTYISSYKSPHHPKINFRLEKLSWELEFLFVNKTLIKLFCFIHKISCRCFILSSYAIKIICPISFPSGCITISIVLYLITTLQLFIKPKNQRQDHYGSAFKQKCSEEWNDCQCKSIIEGCKESGTKYGNPCEDKGKSASPTIFITPAVTVTTSPSFGFSAVTARLENAYCSIRNGNATRIILPPSSCLALYIQPQIVVQLSWKYIFFLFQ